jgi:ParB-like chromosome segregation protein Spo0J
MSSEKIVPDISHEIVYVDAWILNPAEYNPRKHTLKQIEHLKESIKRYGLVDPIIVNRHPDRMNIVIG